MVSTTPQKTPLYFYRSAAGKESVREWLKSLDEPDRQAVGQDLMRRSGDGQSACRCAGQWGRDCGKSAPTCRATGLLVCCCVCTRAHWWPCTDSSRRRRRRLTTSWHWRASARG